MKGRIIAGVFVALVANGGASCLGAAQRYNGDAYDLDSGALLYRESHYLFAADATAQHLVLYRCADGRPFARKLLRDDGNAQAPDFDMADARIDYREGVRRRGDKREVYVQRSLETPEQAELLAMPADGVIDAGFDEYVRRHWDALAAGATLTLPFLVPSKRLFYSFKLAKVENAVNPSLLTIRLSLGAWYAFLLPHIDVAYDRASRRLLNYSGVSNIRDDARKNYNVRIEFPIAPVPATSEQVAAAAAEALTGSCAVVHADTAVPAGGQ
ncbi:MAG: hypothetical protein P4L92_08785 [Rudaea sp.]|nr:hypothetical protein [Rudaea sp.]